MGLNMHHVDTNKYARLKAFLLLANQEIAEHSQTVPGLERLALYLDQAFELAVDLPDGYSVMVN